MTDEREYAIVRGTDDPRRCMCWDVREAETVVHRVWLSLRSYILPEGMSGDVRLVVVGVGLVPEILINIDLVYFEEHLFRRVDLRLVGDLGGMPSIEVCKFLLEPMVCNLVTKRGRQGVRKASDDDSRIW